MVKKNASLIVRLMLTLFYLEYYFNENFDFFENFEAPSSS